MGINDVSAERLRQIDVEGYSPEHDDEHTGGELAAAGACYAMHASLELAENIRQFGVPVWWPFPASEWNLAVDKRQNLVKAAALIIAEIDRIDRARLKNGTTPVPESKPIPPATTDTPE